MIIETVMINVVFIVLILIIAILTIRKYKKKMNEMQIVIDEQEDVIKVLEKDCSSEEKYIFSYAREKIFKKNSINVKNLN
ncbi:hypothetical protein [Chryseobacterium sp. 18068]|uniref:hypothetical protein n=1 Tax=Chryseobacterium sp. 18068 TaxID=2681414 RepID=UPI001358748B|nr:hypothetical protein [Chryseobacterium sp. 18068]